MIGDAIGLGILWLLGFLFLFRVPTLPAADGRSLPRVSIIIPARDEARNLPVLFTSIEQQSLRPLETIVVDDHSQDETAQISRARGARVVTPPPLPEGWLGKNHACWQGAAAARGELFVFLDADTRLEDDGLRRLIETQVVRGGFVSVQPYHRMETAYERLSAFFAFIVMGGIRAFTILGGRLPPRGLFGPAIACRREDYFSIDGHRAVKAAVLEDVELGRTAAEAGYGLHCFAGRGSISFRMYPGGLRDLVDGWTKNFALGAAGTGVVMILLVTAWMAGAGVAIRLLVAGSLAETPPRLLLGLAAYLLYVVQIHFMQVRIGNFGFLSAVLYPFTLLFFMVIFVRSLQLTWLKQTVRWKGRDIAV
ncbi:MAG: glycosyltransferase family 2 protein [Spirochaetia bacterium]